MKKEPLKAVLLTAKQLIKSMIFINILKKEILKKSIDYLPIQLMI